MDLDRVWDMISQDAEQRGEATISRYILRAMYNEREELRAQVEQLSAKCNRLQRVEHRDVGESEDDHA